jgi:predicted regulator of Ras-like GTPase activity (Roadblock/LC7/MglB family)
MPLQGNLKEMSLANLIQINCQEKRSCRLTLTLGNQVGQVFFADGQVVHAALGNTTGEDAIYYMLAWDTGIFALDLEQPNPDVTIRKNWQQLLLEGMKRLPTQQAAKKQVQAEAKPATTNELSQLKAIQGVTGAIIAAHDGIVLATDVLESDGDDEATVTLFIGSAANDLGRILKLDAFEYGTIGMKNKRVMVVAQPNHYIGLVLSDNASAAMVANAAIQAFNK